MDYKELHINSDHDVRIFLVRGEKEFFFAALALHPIDSHLCAYMNIDLARWEKAKAVGERDIFDDEESAYQMEEVVKLFDITYQGTEHPAWAIPPRVKNVIPFEYANYWIGWDWTGRLTPRDEEVLELMDRTNQWITEHVNG